MACGGGNVVSGDWVWVRLPTQAEAVEAAAAEQRRWPSAAATEAAEEERPLKVVFASPAEHFTDAAPIGNGSLGGMVWGGVTTEKIQLNHDTLWTGAPGSYTDPEAPAALVVVRELVNQERFSDATAAATRLFGGQSEVYQPLGDINMEFGASSQAYDSYKRELDLHTATVLVSYNVGEVRYTREHFCSNPHQVMVTKISANIAGKLSCTLSLTSQLKSNATVFNVNEVVMEGICPGQRTGLRKVNSSNVTGIKFAAVLGLQIGGNSAKVAVLNDQKLRLDNADWAVIVVAASSSFSGPFVNPADSKLDPTSIALNTLNFARNLTYDQLKAAHLDDYQRLFYRLTIQLSRGLKDDTHGSLTENERLKEAFGEETSADRVKSFSIDEDPSLVELLFQYGRYLLISCSRPGTQISNLQGIWSQDVAPAWDAAPHLNINLQMNYWPALPCNLSECQEPLFDFLTSLAVNGSKTAKVNYNSSGWVTHHVTDIWAKSSAFLKNPKHAVWPMGGAWLCTHLWEHYQFSLDKVLGKSDTDLVKNVKKALPRLPPIQIARDRTIMEWALDFQDPEVHHRHLSHLFGLFPGHTITLEKNSDVCEAVANTLYKRGEDGPGWSTTWKMALWARLFSSENAYNMILKLITLVPPGEKVDFEGGLYNNLWTAHPPFQIDANFGY
nr:unnamed protein product [Digitaria exilis]